MFADLLENLKRKGGGIHGYAALGEAARSAAAGAPETAAAHYLIASFAESFVEAHERLPLSTQALVQSSQELARHIAEIDAGFASGDAALVLQALNAMAKALVEKE